MIAEFFFLGIFLLIIYYVVIGLRMYVILDFFLKKEVKIQVIMVKEKRVKKEEK